MPRIATITPRGGTAAQWTSANPVLLARELGIETDTQKSKYGDGTTAWNSLPYTVATSAGGSSVDWADVLNKPTTFTPSAHTHVIADTTGLQTALDGKAATSHTHAISQVTDLQASLDAKQDIVSGVSSTEIGYLDGVTSAIQTQINGKAATSHTHVMADITDYVAPTGNGSFNPFLLMGA